MPRIRIRPLPSYPFHTDLQVRVTDLNYGGHLGNDRLLSLIHEARIGFLAAHGFSELDCGGVSLIMGDAALVYLGEAYVGDILRIEVAAGELGRSGFRLFYRITRISDGAAVALAETGMVAFDYRARKIRTLPESVRSVVEAGG